jgi:hypothetical protein
MHIEDVLKISEDIPKTTQKDFERKICEPISIA